MHTKTRWRCTSRKISRNNSVRWNRGSKCISSCQQNLTGHASDCRIVLGWGWISLHYLRNLIKTLTPRRFNPTDRDGITLQGGPTHCSAFRFCILETKHCVWLNLAFYEGSLCEADTDTSVPFLCDDSAFSGVLGTHWLRSSPLKHVDGKCWPF